MLQNPGLVNQFSATPRGQLNWTGPIASDSDSIADAPNSLKNFVGQSQLGENDLRYSQLFWESKNTSGREYALHIQDSQALPRQFHPHGSWLPFWDASFSLTFEIFLLRDRLFVLTVGET